MITAIIETILAILQLIPVVGKWFTKTPLEKENDAKHKVDEEHEKNSEAKRPSDDFWKDHGGV